MATTTASSDTEAHARDTEAPASDTEALTRAAEEAVETLISTLSIQEILEGVEILRLVKVYGYKRADVEMALRDRKSRVEYLCRYREQNRSACNKKSAECMRALRKARKEQKEGHLVDAASP